MGRIGKLLSFLRVTRNNAKQSDVKINPSSGDNITCDHFSDAGDDSYPLITDYVVTIDIPRSGGQSVVGYIDPLTTKKAQKGDKRIYARDSSGQDIVEVWLKNDGTIITSNSNGNIELKPNGDIDINGVNVTINASTKFTVNSPVSEFSDIVNVLGLLSANSFSGLLGSSMTTNVNIETTQDVTADGTSLNTHKHDGVTTGGDNTGEPI